MKCSDLVELSEKTGWNLLNPNNYRNYVYCPQIMLGNREDKNNYLCLWWHDYEKVFKLSCKVDGKVVYHDRVLRFKKIGTYVKWCKKAEQKMKARREKNKLAKMAKDFV